MNAAAPVAPSVPSVPLGAAVAAHGDVVSGSQLPSGATRQPNRDSGRDSLSGQPNGAVEGSLPHKKSKAANCERGEEKAAPRQVLPPVVNEEAYPTLCAMPAKGKRR